MSTRAAVLDRRRAGVLLHLGCLEGGLGRSGREFVDWLAAAGFTVWQLLPLGPTGSDRSPYWVRSDVAGNPEFIDSHELPEFGSPAYEAFKHQAAGWLDDYALFEAVSAEQGGAPFWQWPTELRDRHPAALAATEQRLSSRLEGIRREQFAFSEQWRLLREYAHGRGVRLFGDLPFYVAPDSVETWARRSQFQLESDGRPRMAAGVPPDYFSELGQLWGNPLYDWAAIGASGYRFWRTRILRQLERVDLLRIDHFRALAAHWAVPAGAPDARGGFWQPTPGKELLSLLQSELGRLPLVAEDLGVITPDVEALRSGFELPGMRVLQFAFSGEATNPYLPFMHTRDSVVYTGTHDNDTTLGWYESLAPATRRQVDDFLDLRPGGMPRALERSALGSVGQLAILPAQDLLALRSAARLNTPGTALGNWSWRLPRGALTRELAAEYAQLNRMYGRS